MENNINASVFLFNMNITKEQLKKIKEFTTEFYKGLDKYHNIEHMKKAVEIAEFIAKKENADVELARLGAMIHQFHIDMDKFESFLKGNVKEEVKSKLLEIAGFRAHRAENKDVCKEAKIAYDADGLQLIGPKGVLREITCNLEVRGKPFDKSVEDARKIEKLFYDNLQTKTGKEIAEKQYQITKKFWEMYDKEIFQ